MSSQTTIADLAEVIRSKNAGPFMYCIDIFFRDRNTYEKMKKSSFITRQLIAGLYDITPREVVGVYYWDVAKAVKVTILRKVPCGNPQDTDVYGAQQHIPLRNLIVPRSVLE